MSDTKTTSASRLPSWLRYSEQVDAQIARHTTPDKIDAAARESWNTDTAVINGAPTYRDPGSDERYTVGYGGERTYASKPAVRTGNGASPKQAALIDTLLEERFHLFTEDDVIKAKADWRLTRKMIDTLLDKNKCPRRTDQAPVPVIVQAPVEPERKRLDFSAILDGNYAVRGGDGVVKFYRISTNKKGFKNVQIRASDELHPVQWKAGIAIMHQIVEAGLAESRMLFVTELERCCKCGRSLTDEESRANARVNGGYGPDCAGK